VGTGTAAGAWEIDLPQLAQNLTPGRNGALQRGQYPPVEATGAVMEAARRAGTDPTGTNEVPQKPQNLAPARTGR